MQSHTTLSLMSSSVCSCTLSTKDHGRWSMEMETMPVAAMCGPTPTSNVQRVQGPSMSMMLMLENQRRFAMWNHVRAPV